MILFKRKDDLKNCLAMHRKNGNRIGFVPTMGALHKGHLSLIEASKHDTSITVCSIFVNPAQFNDPKDYEKYPVTIENDILLLVQSGCDVLFLPSVKEIYPEETSFQEHAISPRSLRSAGRRRSKGVGRPHYDLGYLETVLEGKFRPGHFQGVCKVMDRLLEIVSADNLYLGQKDYQQCMVIKRLIELNGKSGIKVIVCPTLREQDGLAMSSRNMRLNKDEREMAPAIYQTLTFVKNNLKSGSLKTLKEKSAAKLNEKGFKIDYIEIADAAALRLVDVWDGRQKLVALVAAFVNEVRLIDNLLLHE